MKIRIVNYVFIVSLLLIVNLTATTEGEAEGNLIVNNLITQLNYAYAIAEAGFFDESKEDIKVILTDVPLSAEAIEDSFERKKMMNKGDLHCIEVIINSDKNPISVTILHNAFNAPPSGRGYEVLDVSTFTENLIEGKIYTSKPNEFFNTTYEFTASFTAAIRRELPQTEAEKLEAENSIFAALYKQYEKYIRESNFEEFKNLVTKEVAGEMSENDAEEMFDFMQFSMPASVEYLRIKEDDEKGILEMSAEMDGRKISGKVNFLFEDNQWKISQTSWEE